MSLKPNYDWLDFAKEKTIKYGGFLPNTVDPNQITCELFAQGRMIERNKRLRATRLYEQDIIKAGDDLEKLCDVLKGCDFRRWRTVSTELLSQNQGTTS